MTTDGRPTSPPAPEIVKRADKAPTDPPIYSEAQSADQAEDRPKGDPADVPAPSTLGPDLVKSDEPDGA
jgi:hypothetical protein